MCWSEISCLVKYCEQLWGLYFVYLFVHSTPESSVKQKWNSDSEIKLDHSLYSFRFWRSCKNSSIYYFASVSFFNWKTLASGKINKMWDLFIVIKYTIQHAIRNTIFRKYCSKSLFKAVCVHMLNIQILLEKTRHFVCSAHARLFHIQVETRNSASV